MYELKPPHWKPFISETGSAITATNVGMGNDLHPPPGVAGKPVPGWDGNYIIFIKNVADHVQLSTLHNTEVIILKSNTFFHPKSLVVKDLGCSSIFNH